jgi:hypothetical protein
MAFELVHTSVPRGLKPGSQGYCTVAYTRGMPANYVELGEELSHYAAYYRVTDPRYLLSPVAYSHGRVFLGGRHLSLLSRTVCHAPDYSGRTNYLAHHLMLDLADDDAARQGPWPPPAGPAALMQAPETRLFLDTWQGEPRLLEPLRRLPRAAPASPRPQTWEALAGSAGWAGVLAQHSWPQDAPAACVVYDPEQLPGPEVLLSLVAEAMALLPPSRRWQVTFHTYFQRLSAKSPCSWRFCVSRNAEAIQAVRRTPGHLLLDLTQPLGALPGGELVACALEGRQPTWAEDATPGAPGPAGRRSFALRGLGSPAGAGAADRASLRPAPIAAPPRVVTIEDISPQLPPGGQASQDAGGHGRVLAWAVPVTLALLLLILMCWYRGSRASAAAVRNVRATPTAAAGSAPPAPPAETAPGPAEGTADTGTAPGPLDPAPAADILASPDGTETSPAQPAAGNGPPAAITALTATRRVLVPPEPFSRTGISLQAARNSGLPLRDDQSFWDCDVALLCRGQRVDPRLKPSVPQGGHPFGSVGDQPCRVADPTSPCRLNVFRDALGFPKAEPVDAVILSGPEGWQALLLLDPVRVADSLTSRELDMADAWRPAASEAPAGQEAAAPGYSFRADAEFVAGLGTGLGRLGFDDPQVAAVLEVARSPDLAWTVRLALGPGDLPLALGVGETVPATRCTVPVAVASRTPGEARLAFRFDRGARIAPDADGQQALDVAGLEEVLAAAANRLLAKCRALPPDDVARAFRRCGLAGGQDPGSVAGAAERIGDLRWRLGSRQPDPARLEQTRAARAELGRRLAAAVPAAADADPVRKLDEALAAFTARLSLDEVERLRSGPLQAAVDAAVTCRDTLAGARGRLSGRGQEEPLRKAEEEARNRLAGALGGLLQEKVLRGRALPEDAANALTAQFRDLAVLAVSMPDRQGDLSATRTYLDAAVEHQQHEQARQYRDNLDAALRAWDGLLTRALQVPLSQGRCVRAVLLEVTGGRRGDREDKRPFLRLAPAAVPSADRPD